ncbi:MAG: TlpA family protein disulfide reductase [Actinobacteria bacterium]|nr:TlpA family protein disulfide reductase [Actinomycetota bacterium]
MRWIATFTTVLVAATALAGCGGSDNGRAGDAPAAAAYKPDLNGADLRLAQIYKEASKLLDGGRAAYDKRVATLRGLPIVVNKWGSWCGPCRNEFPLFQRAAKEHGGKIAFLGVNVSDGKADARAFLRQRPVPYPSYVDPRLFISQLLPPAAAAPSTGFYNAAGKLVHVKAGEYRNAAALEEDIRRYATSE